MVTTKTELLVRTSDQDGKDTYLRTRSLVFFTDTRDPLSKLPLPAILAERHRIIRPDGSTSHMDYNLNHADAKKFAAELVAKLDLK